MTDQEKDHSALWEKAFHSHFWPSYPRKVAKREAIKAWHQARPKNREDFRKTALTILKALQASLDDEFQDQHTKFIPYPATWLRREEFSQE